MKTHYWCPDCITAYGSFRDAVYCTCFADEAAKERIESKLDDPRALIDRIKAVLEETVHQMRLV